MSSHASAMRAINFRPYTKNTLRAFFDLEMPSGLVILGCMLHEKGDRRWVGLPARPYEDEGTRQWAPIVDFRDKAAAFKFQDAAVVAALAAAAEAKEGGR